MRYERSIFRLSRWERGNLIISKSRVGDSDRRKFTEAKPIKWKGITDRVSQARFAHDIGVVLFLIDNPSSRIYRFSSLIMSFNNLMSGAECSTSTNPLNQFSKHVGQDKSLQRDRFIPGITPNQGMRGDTPISSQDRKVSILARDVCTDNR